MPEHTPLWHMSSHLLYQEFTSYRGMSALRVHCVTFSWYIRHSRKFNIIIDIIQCLVCA